MRVLVTGASGFVGSNLVHVLRDRCDVVAPSHAELDLTREVPRDVDAIVHAAIWNALDGLLSDRRRAWDGYVEATRNCSFTVWDAPSIKRVATPVLATDAAELIWRALERGATGTLHCVGSEHIDRVALARRAVEAFDLDGELLQVGPPPSAPAERIPVDTRLDASETARRLDVELPDVGKLLEGLACAST